MNAFLKEANVYDENGIPLSTGHEASIHGLYFCGYYVSPTGMLREITREAKRVSKKIAINR